MRGPWTPMQLGFFAAALSTAVLGTSFPAAAALVVTTVAGTGAAGALNGPGNVATFNWPYDVALDSSGNVYVPDYGNEIIRKITPAGVVSTYAGTVGVGGTLDGPATTAKFDLPNRVAVDSTDNVYVFDYTYERLRKITPAGIVSTIAGNGGPGTVDGVGAAASFFEPFGLAADAFGNVYMGEAWPSRIRKITSGAVVTNFAGGVGQNGWLDGTGPAAKFASPNGTAVDAAGNIYVADTGNYVIRKITPAGVVTTIAGTPQVAGYIDGPASSAKFQTPFSIAVDSSGTVYVGDGVRVRKIAGGVVSTLAGSGVGGFADGPALSAQFMGMQGIAVDIAGAVYVADSANRRIRKIADDTPPPPAAVYEYAVKYVCGTPVATRRIPVPPVAYGAYFTAINVHNPSDQAVTFRKKFVVALPSEREGPISAFSFTTIHADAALEIDCPDILAHLQLTGFAKGFVVIQSPVELDVVAVYTAAATAQGHVETLEIERVPARKK